MSTLTIKMNFSLAYSPCPNDTFIFDALANRKLASSFDFDIMLHDVQELNKLAIEQQFDVTKISFAVYPFIAAHYQILEAGAALGFNCGPLLISKKIYEAKSEVINALKIGIPGVHTTANLLLSIAFPDAINRVPMLFSAIEDAVLQQELDAGLIIHENRFTYEAKGLNKIIDLGEFWQSSFNFPIPLGCIVVRRSLPEDVKQAINDQIRASLSQAKKNSADTMNYVKQHASELSEEVMQQHIDLYVNDFSLSLAEQGKNAINFLFQKGHEVGLLPVVEKRIFL